MEALEAMQAFSRVAELGSFTRAADELGLSRAMVSTHVRRLEKRFGLRLLNRTTRKVALTPFGVHVLPYIDQVLAARASLVHQTQAFLSPDKRLIRIGTSPLISAHLLRLMIEPFRIQHPSVDVVLREMNMTDLYRLLDDGLLDFVFGVAGTHKGPLIATFLYEEPLLFIPRGGVGSNALRPQSVQLKDIAGETYVMVPDACGLSRATRALFRSQRRKLHEYSGEAMSYQVLQEWAALGIGAAILPSSKVANGQASVPITIKSGHQASLAFEAIWSRAATRSGHLLEFATHLRKVVPGIVSGLGPGARK